MKQQADLLIKNIKIYTQDVQRTVLMNSDVAVQGDRIAEVGKNLTEKWEAANTIDGTGKALFPGMHNMHVHIFQSLLKGLGADLSLLDWLKEAPLKGGPNFTPELYALACKVATMESLKCGVTTIADFNYLQQNDAFPHASIAVMEQVGIRGIYMDCYHDTGLEMGVFPGFIHPADEAIRRTDALVKQYHTPEHPLIRIWAGASVPWGTTRDLFVQMAEYSKETGLPYTMHILETESDNEYCMKTFGKPTIATMEELGVLTPRLLAVHCVRLQPDEIKTFAKYGVNAAYCPMANTYLGSGIPPMAEMHRQGINITMATDGAASNNSSDMMESLKTGLLLQKGMECNPQALTAQDMLDFTTLNAAKAEQRTDIGSIEEGKLADFFVYNPNFLRSAPDFDTLATLMYNSGQENIETTIVGGKIVYHKGEFACGLDEHQVAAEAQATMVEFMKHV